VSKACIDQWRSLVKLEPRDVQRMLDEMFAKLSPTTKRYAHGVLRTTLARAVKLGYVVRSVAALVDPPARAKYEMRPFSREEAQAFLASLAATEDAPADRFEALYTLALHTGARQGELLGLCWSDVDDGSLTIRHTLRQGTAELGEPKTKASRRTLALGPTAQAVLRKQRVAQAAERLKAGRTWHDLDFVFTTRLGMPLDAVNVTRLPAVAEGSGPAEASVPRFQALVRHART